MDMKLPSTWQNTAVQKQTANVTVSVNIPVYQRNMAGVCTSLPMIIQGCFTYRQETQKRGKRNTIEGLCVERSNKRKKEDYKLENGRHRSTKCGTAASTAS